MKKQIIPMIILAAVMMKGTAQALPTLGRSVTGIVQQVDVKTREVEMRRDDKSAPLKFVWTQRTMFLAPFFGKPFVTRAKLLQAQVLEPASKAPSK